MAVDLEERSRMFVEAVARGDTFGAQAMAAPNAEAVWNGSMRAASQSIEHLCMIKGPWTIEEVVVKRNLALISWHAKTVRGLLTISWDRNGQLMNLNATVRT